MPDNHQIAQLRGSKNPVNPDIPYHFLHEQEPAPDGSLQNVNTLFLTGRECAFKCLMCDLWKNTLDSPTPPGAIVRQIDYALARLPEAPTVAVICTPPATWPGIIHKLGGLGTRAAIIVGEVRSDDDRLALRHALSAARPNLLRIVGPGSLGVVSPALHAHLGAPSCTVKAGGVAWVSQSNALTNAVLG